MELDTIYNEDCMLTLSKIEDNSIDLIVTSPPYNKGLHPRNGSKNKMWDACSRKIEYSDYSDDMPQEEYINWQKNILTECLRVLKPTGSIFYNHKESFYEGLAIFPSYIYDFPVHQTIIWDRGGSCANDPHYFQNQNEFVFWIVKDAKQTYFDKSKSAFRQTIWRINAEHNSKHPAPYPLLLAQNCIAVCCPNGGIVYDPFMGSGTTAIASIKSKCHYIGSEISAQYVEMAERRIREHNAQLSIW